MLPKRFSPDKTSILNDGKNIIMVSSLPLNLQEEFGMIDRMKEDIAELSYKLEVMTLALRAKGQELAVAVSSHMSASIPEEKSKDK